MDRPDEAGKCTPLPNDDAVTIEFGLRESCSYLDENITSEYQFLRESYENRHTPPHLLTGSLLVAGLAGYIYTHLSNKSVHFTVYSVAEFVLFTFSIFVLILASSLLTKPRYPKIDRFALESDLLDLYWKEFLLTSRQLTSMEETDASVLTRLRWSKIRLLEGQMKLYRSENRRRHHIQIVITLAMLCALLMGAILAGSIAAHPS